MVTTSGSLEERICPWARYVTRPKEYPIFEQVVWDPPPDQVYHPCMCMLCVCTFLCVCALCVCVRACAFEGVSMSLYMRECVCLRVCACMVVVELMFSFLRILVAVC